MCTEVVSAFFSEVEEPVDLSERTNPDNSLCDNFLELINKLNLELEQIQLPKKVEVIYNPTIYARHTFEMYIRKFCNTPKKIMYFGMNPGPWGMSQTGVPFGEISSVRDWLEIEGPVGKPPNEIEARPVMGFQCHRTEVSGKNFWGAWKEICGTPDKFFRTSFVYNYLPQQWMNKNGCNITPGDFSVSQMEQLYDICDPLFIEIVKLYEVEKIVAVGGFCRTRAQKALKKYLPRSNIEILYLKHPSPRAVNNHNWSKNARGYLEDLNLLEYYN